MIINEEMPGAVCSSLYQEIQDDIIVFRKNRDKISLDAVRFIYGEIQRSPDKDYSDETVIKALRSLRKTMLKSPEPDYIVVALIGSYIPEPLTEPEIRGWMHVSNLDVATVKSMKNPYSIIGMITKAHSDREVDGAIVKKIVDEILNGVLNQPKPMKMAEDVAKDLHENLIIEVPDDRMITADDIADLLKKNKYGLDADVDNNPDLLK